LAFTGPGCCSSLHISLIRKFAGSNTQKLNIAHVRFRHRSIDPNILVEPFSLTFRGTDPKSSSNSQTSMISLNLRMDLGDTESSRDWMSCCRRLFTPGVAGLDKGSLSSMARRAVFSSFSGGVPDRTGEDFLMGEWTSFLLRSPDSLVATLSFDQLNFLSGVAVPASCPSLILVPGAIITHTLA